MDRRDIVGGQAGSTTIRPFRVPLGLKGEKEVPIGQRGLRG